MKVWKTQEYFVYFKFFKLHSWGKTSASNRSGFDDWMPINKTRRDESRRVAK